MRGQAKNCRMIHPDDLPGTPTIEKRERKVRAHARHEGFVFLSGPDCISVSANMGWLKEENQEGD
jgi:hypothetical protein